MKLDLRIMRQGIDPTAESALLALRDIMRLPILAVEHGSLLRFVLAQAPGDATTLRRRLERAACRAGRYVNVNRDAMLWEESDSTQPAPAAGCHVDVLVTQHDADDARAQQWFRQHGVPELQRVMRGRWYRIHVDTADLDTARRQVEDLACARTRRHGLLANPHAEQVTVLRWGHNAPGGIHHAV